jgi:hypothetical protein
MKSSGLDWNGVITDLARHLASASAAEQVQLILGDAQRSLARLEAPPDFWPRVREAYKKVPRKRSADGAAADLVEPLLDLRCSSAELSRT